MKKQLLLLLILIFNYQSSLSANPRKIIIKANILRGESLVTAAVDPRQIEGVFEEALKIKGFERVDSQLTSDSLYFLDAFVFQYPGAYPTVTITIRTINGVHYVDKDNIKIFGDRVAASIKVAGRLAEKLPQQIDTKVQYDLSFKDIVSNSRISIIGGVSNAITKEYRDNYANLINWNSSEAPHFIVPQFIEYLNFCADFQGIRKSLKEKPIILKLKIGENGSLQIDSIQASFDLDEKKKQKLQKTIDAFPIWISNRKYDNIEMTLGVI